MRVHRVHCVLNPTLCRYVLLQICFHPVRYCGSCKPAPTVSCHWIIKVRYDFSFIVGETINSTVNHLRSSPLCFKRVFSNAISSMFWLKMYYYTIKIYYLLVIWPKYVWIPSYILCLCNNLVDRSLVVNRFHDVPNLVAHYF